jgi:hypothetical protein
MKKLLRQATRYNVCDQPLQFGLVFCFHFFVFSLGLFYLCFVDISFLYCYELLSSKERREGDRREGREQWRQEEGGRRAGEHTSSRMDSSPCSKPAFSLNDFPYNLAMWGLREVKLTKLPNRGNNFRAHLKNQKKTTRTPSIAVEKGSCERKKNSLRKKVRNPKHTVPRA